MTAVIVVGVGPITYVWYGSGRRWDILPLIVGAIGGLMLAVWQVKIPQEILDNPGLATFFGIVVGVISGATFVFVLRLLWWPIYRVLEPQGGLSAVLRATAAQITLIRMALLLLIGGWCLFSAAFGIIVWKMWRGELGFNTAQLSNSIEKLSNEVVANAAKTALLLKLRQLEYLRQNIDTQYAALVPAGEGLRKNYMEGRLNYSSSLTWKSIIASKWNKPLLELQKTIRDYSPQATLDTYNAKAEAPEEEKVSDAGKPYFRMISFQLANIKTVVPQILRQIDETIDKTKQEIAND